MLKIDSANNALETKLFTWLQFEDKAHLKSLMETYINITGNQQYWDFFAPNSPKYHQYLSVCEAIISLPEIGKITCKNKPLFSNFANDFAVFKAFGSDRSRLYRLTENLSNLEDPLLLNAMANYYRQQQTPVQIVLHQFELHPELNDLPKEGYRMDRLLWSQH